MRKHFESGLAFIVVAAMSVAAGVLMFANGTNPSGFIFLGAGGLWFIVAIGVRNKFKNAKKDDEKGSGPSN